MLNDNLRQPLYLFPFGDFGVKNASHFSDYSDLDTNPECCLCFHPLGTVYIINEHPFSSMSFIEKAATKIQCVSKSVEFLVYSLVVKKDQDILTQPLQGIVILFIVS